VFDRLPSLTARAVVADHACHVMRTRLGGILAMATLLGITASSCATAGVSYVYMAIDSSGNQHRQTFYTDSSAIYCIAKVSSARADATIDFIIRQKSTKPWCNPGTTDTIDSHPDFANGEQTPGVGVENVVAGQLLPSGTAVAVQCNGYCTQNLPTGNLCTLGPNQMASGICRPTYESLGVDSCGIGLTCCETTVAGLTQTGAPLSSVPFPAGEYTCVVNLDGVEAGSSDFSIDYPPGDCPVASPISGIPCYNWVPRGAKCPGDVNMSTCTCDITGVWNCT
jgi:hypothetical protein